MKRTKLEIIKYIASSIDCGESCYYNFKTEEIITIHDDFENFDDEDFQNMMKKDLKKIASQKNVFIKVEPLKSFEFYEIMKNFIQEVDNNNLKNNLLEILERKKPFKNFKHLIDNTDYREPWFIFKQNEIEKIVKKQLKLK